MAVAGYDYRLNAGSWQLLGNVLTTNLANLVSPASYTFNVRARDAAGNLGPAASGNFSTPDDVPPTVPTNLGATSPASNTVNLSWTASTDNVAVTGYRIFRGDGQIGTSATTSYTDNTVSGSIGYSYKVSAYDAANNNSAQSAAANVTTPDTIAPTIPTGLTATAISSTQINLSWSDTRAIQVARGLAGYRIYRNGSQINTSVATSLLCRHDSIAWHPVFAHGRGLRQRDACKRIWAVSCGAAAITFAVLSASVTATTWNWTKRRD